MEIWKPAPAPFDLDYAISSLGRVRRETTRTRAKAGSLLKLVPDKDGYVTVNLYTNGKGHCCRVHRLVYEVFHGPIAMGLVIDHLNSIRDDNRAVNLEAVTSTENIRRGYQRNGRAPTGNKVTPAQVVEIREARSAGERVSILAVKYGVTNAAVSSICTGRTWKNVGGPITPSVQGRPKGLLVGKRMSVDQVVEVREARAAGASLSSLAKTYGVGVSTVSKICLGKTWVNAGGPITSNVPNTARIDSLTDEEALEAMRAVRDGESRRTIAERVGVSRATIDNWMSDKLRAHLLTAV